MIFPYRHWHARDWRFVALLLLCLAAVGAYLGTGSARLEQSGSGWRRIDIERVRQLVDSDELSGKEAQWFHESLPQEGSGGSQTR